MSGSLFDSTGARKYLIDSERRAFAREAKREVNTKRLFCLALAASGARISELLATTAESIDRENGTLILRTLKQREKLSFRSVPLPRNLVSQLLKSIPAENGPIWDWGRTNAWQMVKAVMRRAGISENLCKPKALRHGFAVSAGLAGVPLNVVQRWLGHARLETTAIYMSIVGPEERLLAKRTWQALNID